MTKQKSGQIKRETRKDITNMLTIIRNVLCFLLSFAFIYLGAVNIMPDTPAIICATGMFLIGAFGFAKDFV